MRFRLGWPDFALFALLALISWDFLSKYRQSAGRHSILESVSAGSQESRSPAVPPPEAIRPADYGAIASSLFFVPQSSSAPEATPRPLVEAPPGPLPVLFGVADLGDGPSALLSPTRGERAQWTSPGEMIGGYRLQEIGAGQLVFTRNGRRFPTTPAELRAGSAQRAESRRAPAVPRRQQAVGAARSGIAPARLATAASAYRIGTEFRPGRFAADAADGAADGTVFRGYVRRVRQTPFGEQHWWEKREP